MTHKFLILYTTVTLNEGQGHPTDIKIQSLVVSTLTLKEIGLLMSEYKPMLKLVFSF